MRKNVEEILDSLINTFGENVVMFEGDTKQPTVHINNREQLIEIMVVLKEEFSFLADLTAAEYEDQMEVIYHLMSLEDGAIIRVKVKLDTRNLMVSSITSLWNSANVQEREVWDMFGIRFFGHPNLKSILLPDDAQIHPLRKNFSLIQVDGEG